MLFPGGCSSSKIHNVAPKSCVLLAAEGQTGGYIHSVVLNKSSNAAAHIRKNFLTVTN